MKPYWAVRQHFCRTPIRTPSIYASCLFFFTKYTKNVLTGCGCENTEFGCCLDNRTPAQGPNKEGCGCEASKFSCCPDGETEAQGEKFEGCNEVPVTPGSKLCLLKCGNATNTYNFPVILFFVISYRTLLTFQTKLII